MIVYYKYKTKFTPKAHGWFQCEREDLDNFLKKAKEIYTTRIEVKFKTGSEEFGKRWERWLWTSMNGTDGKRGWRKIEFKYPYKPANDPGAIYPHHFDSKEEYEEAQRAADEVFGTVNAGDWLMNMINEIIFDK